MYIVYILKSINIGMYYVGCTADIDQRISEHNRQIRGKFTNRGAPWNLVHKESFTNLCDARKREKQIKSWKSRSAIERLIGPIV